MWMVWNGWQWLNLIMFCGHFVVDSSTGKRDGEFCVTSANRKKYSDIIRELPSLRL